MATKTIGKKKPKASAPPTTTLGRSGLGAPERTEVKRLHVLLYGPPKSGKSIMAHQLPRTRTIDFDDGMQSIEWAIRAGIISNRTADEIVYRTILPPLDPKDTSVLDTATDTIDEWLADEDIPEDEWDKPYEQKWDTLIIDSASPLTQAAIMKGMKENDRLNLSKSWKRYTGSVIPMQRQDWGAASNLFMQFVNFTRSIGKNVVLIAHEYHNTTDEGTLQSIDPLVIGQLRQQLPGSFDEVWYATVKGTRNDPKYVFQTTPDNLRRCGSRLGCLEPLETSDFDALRNKIAAFYGVRKDLLWTAAHGSAERLEDEAEGNANI
jgi:hypothetical protein